MATFDSFSVSYSSGSYRFQYTYTPNSPTYIITAIINTTRLETISDSPSAFIEIQEAVYPQYFTQGISMEMYLESDDGPTQSTYLYRVFMKQNDSRNRALSSNVRKWTISDANAQYTSILLPPIGTNQSNIFGTKYIDAGVSKSFFLVSGFVGYSNAPSSQLIVANDPGFAGVFDYRFDQTSVTGNVGRQEFNSGFNYGSLAVVSNGSQWLNIGAFVGDSNLSFGQLTLPITDSNKADTNKGILYYQCTDSNYSTIVLSSSIPNNFEKNIYIRNLTGVNVTFNVVAPSTFTFENNTQTADRAVLSFPVNNNSFKNIGLLSQYGTSNRLYITSTYSGHNLTPLTTYPTGLQTLTKTMNYINSTAPHVLLSAAYPSNGAARICTIVPTSVGSNSTCSTYNVISNSYFAISSNNQVTSVGLDAGSYWYTFAVLYKNATESNVILPLSGWPL